MKMAAAVTTNLSVAVERPKLNHQMSANEYSSSNQATTSPVIRGPLVKQDSVVEEIEKRQRESLSKKLKDRQLPSSSSSSSVNKLDLPTIAGGPSLRQYMQRPGSRGLYQSPSTTVLPTFNVSRTSNGRPALPATRHSVSGYPLRQSQSLSFLDEETTGADAVDLMSKDAEPAHVNGDSNNVRFSLAKIQNESSESTEPKRVPFTWKSDNRSSTNLTRGPKIDEITEDTFEDVGCVAPSATVRHPLSISRRPVSLSSTLPVFKSIDGFPDEGFVSQLSMSSDDAKVSSDDNVFGDEEPLSSPGEEERRPTKDKSTTEHNISSFDNEMLINFEDTPVTNHPSSRFQNHTSINGTTSNSSPEDSLPGVHTLELAPIQSDINFLESTSSNISKSDKISDDNQSTQNTEGQLSNENGENQFVIEPINTTYESQSATLRLSQVPIELADSTVEHTEVKKPSNGSSPPIRSPDVVVNSTTATLSVKLSSSNSCRPSKYNSTTFVDKDASTCPGFLNGHSNNDDQHFEEKDSFEQESSEVETKNQSISKDKVPTGSDCSSTTNGSTLRLMEVEWVRGSIGLGFCIEGGRDSPLGDLPITVKRLFKGETSAQKILQAGDELVTVNDTSLVGVNHFRAWNILKAIPTGPVRMTIRRK